jgi:hypothetical protein
VALGAPTLQGLAGALSRPLIGMGDSDKLGADAAQRYTFGGIASSSTRCWRSSASAVMRAGRPRLGQRLGFDWARRHPRQVAAIARMEALVRPPRQMGRMAPKRPVRLPAAALTGQEEGSWTAICA